MRHSPFFPLTWSLLASAVIAASSLPAEAGGKFFRRHDRPMVETVAVERPENRVAPSPMLGTFRGTPYIFVRGNGVAGGGYSTLGGYGRENSLSVYGPLSVFREVSAPIDTVVRGYDGIPRVVPGTAFSNPNQPTLSPVIYPTRASNYSALRFQGTPPQWDKALMWIDQN